MLNCRLDLDLEISAALSKTDDDIRGEHLNRHFPSSVVELTSCEQFNIKFNEIFEYRVNQILLESPGNTTHIHKHDYLNETQSPDIVFSIGRTVVLLYYKFIGSFFSYVHCCSVRTRFSIICGDEKAS
ncbi:unnamed protein product [Rotaria magnacalcarata]|uniref:Uncharacterized protein n=1 Tax=Rotaria magnacalcarata TaxID=392030 RepID=A0A8S3D1T6_9BILA|nr:unnamed protein product [Rotaria magnacalcarata]